MRNASPKAKTRSRAARFFPSSTRSRSVCALGAPTPAAPTAVAIAGSASARRPAVWRGRTRRRQWEGPPAWFCLFRGRLYGRPVRWWRFRGARKHFRLLPFYHCFNKYFCSAFKPLEFRKGSGTFEVQSELEPGAGSDEFKTVSCEVLFRCIKFWV